MLLVVSTILTTSLNISPCGKTKSTIGVGEPPRLLLEEEERSILVDLLSITHPETHTQNTYHTPQPNF